MGSEDDLEGVPESARAALRQTEHNEIVRTFNEALHVVAFCQRKLKIRQVISILSARGGVNVAILGDASGNRNARYATIDWNSLRQAVHGAIPQPESH
jgi:hypothetical protein